MTLSIRRCNEISESINYQTPLFVCSIVFFVKECAGSVDLRANDAFGRNALYYTCLCGHVQAAHFVAVHAYGGVEVRLVAVAVKCAHHTIVTMGDIESIIQKIRNQLGFRVEVTTSQEFSRHETYADDAGSSYVELVHACNA